LTEQFEGIHARVANAASLPVPTSSPPYTERLKAWLRARAAVGIVAAALTGGLAVYLEPEVVKAGAGDDDEQEGGISWVRVAGYGLAAGAVAMLLAGRV
jgi:hypothetical protein